MTSRWIEHKGKQILYVDVANLGEDVNAIAEEIRTVAAMAAHEPEGSVLGLADLRGTVLTQDLASRLKNSVPEINRYIGRAAVVVDRLTGFKRVILDAVARVAGRNVTVFESLEEAQDWLVSGD